MRVGHGPGRAETARHHGYVTGARRWAHSSDASLEIHYSGRQWDISTLGMHYSPRQRRARACALYVGQCPGHVSLRPKSRRRAQGPLCAPGKRDGLSTPRARGSPHKRRGHARPVHWPIVQTREAARNVAYTSCARFKTVSVSRQVWLHPHIHNIGRLATPAPCALDKAPITRKRLVNLGVHLARV